MIVEKSNIEKKMSLWRSGQRGSASEASNFVLEQVVIDSENIWRKVERPNGDEASFGMR